VHQCEIAWELLVRVDPLIVVEKIPAAVQHEPIPVHLEGLGMMATRRSNSITAGAAASAASRPAPAVLMPARRSVARVSSSPAYPPVQDVVAGEHAAVELGGSEAGDVVRMHPIVDRLVAPGSRVITSRTFVAVVVSVLA
jgi:hypothetical protein